MSSPLRDSASSSPSMKSLATSEVFSWNEPHSEIAFVFVGEEEVPFCLQKNLLRHRASFFATYFENAPKDLVEYTIKLPQCSPRIFGLAQNFMVTGAVWSVEQGIPTYEELISLWQLAHELDIYGLCEKALETMRECKGKFHRIPAPVVIVRVWNETPEGSGIRELILTWAAEYVMSSDGRSEFAKALPQEVLSELVIKMSALSEQAALENAHVPDSPTGETRKNVHYLNNDESDVEMPPNGKRHRRLPGGSSASTPVSVRKGAPPSTNASSTSASRSSTKKSSTMTAGATINTKSSQRRRISSTVAPDVPYSSDPKLNFCADLLTRMLSGPGFWTRLVKPFRQPVDPVIDGVPDYLEKVTKPMDLSTIKAKMDGHGYKSDTEFLADMHQIFANCYHYWSPGDTLYTECEKFEKTFEEKFAMMAKWINKTGNDTSEAV